MTFHKANRLLSLSVLASMLAACVSTQPTGQPGVRPPPGRPPSSLPPTRPADPPPTGFRAPQVMRMPGLDGVIDQNAASLRRIFGQPRLDVAEGDMRKLQFVGQACVLDVFLYPLRPSAEPVATYVEARRASDGQEVDRPACVNALRQRR